MRIMVEMASFIFSSCLPVRKKENSEDAQSGYKPGYVTQWSLSQSKGDSGRNLRYKTSLKMTY